MDLFSIFARRFEVLAGGWFRGRVGGRGWGLLSLPQQLFPAVVAPGRVQQHVCADGEGRVGQGEEWMDASSGPFSSVAEPLQPFSNVLFCFVFFIVGRTEPRK